MASRDRELITAKMTIWNGGTVIALEAFGRYPFLSTQGLGWRSRSTLSLRISTAVIGPISARFLACCECDPATLCRTLNCPKRKPGRPPSMTKFERKENDATFPCVQGHHTRTLAGFYALCADVAHISEWIVGYSSIAQPCPSSASSPAGAVGPDASINEMATNRQSGFFRIADQPGEPATLQK